MKDSVEANDAETDLKASFRTILIVSQYPTLFIPFAFLSMALFHFPLWFNGKISFYKLMGCGKNGTFDIRPDLHQWAIMVFYRQEGTTPPIKTWTNQLLGTFISFWWRLFRVRNQYFHLEPIAGHGTWDGKTFIQGTPNQVAHEGKIGVLTRATIRLSRLISFWKAVPAAADQFEQNPGFIYSVGIGEIPFIKQATFSIWENEEQMKAFAYKRNNHKDVIRRTREEGWYSEEMFLRFKILETS
ncbi:MAG: DUF3291 domain-containing protein [Cyclobacteriaceae bacterium]